MPNYNIEREVIKKAFHAASFASAVYKAKNGETFPCGFAWVVIKPATSRIVRTLKEMQAELKDADIKNDWRRYGDKHYKGGWCVYNPGMEPTQSMYVKAAGADAFVEVLAQHGIQAHAEARLD